jgi:glycine betaine/proline transport system substrate-binding protein
MISRVQLTVLGIFAFLILVIVSLWLTFGGGDIADSEQYEEAQDNERQVELVYVEWASEIASTYVVKVVLEQLGYEVDVISVSAAAMWQAVASGDADGHIAAWLPTTHAHYLKAVKDNLVNLGPNLEGTKIGLVVPNYVTIDSIEELNAQIDKFDGKIIGIDPGAGLMSKTEKVVEDYKLSQFKLIEGSGASMTAALAEAIRTQEWIVVTGWTPHWKFARWQLKYLKDPKNIYGQEEYIGTVVRKGLKEEMPEVYRVLDNFYWTATDMGQVMIMNQQKNTTPYENAKRWVDDNQDLVSKWLSQ